MNAHSQIEAGQTVGQLELINSPAANGGAQVAAGHPVRALVPIAQPDDGKCWALPRQDRMEVYATNDDTIEIVQISPMGESEDVRIDIARSNAVALARRILYAAGFSGLCLGGAVNGRGYYDLHDGSLPEHFDGFYEPKEDVGAAE